MYIYITTKQINNNPTKIAGVIQARHSFEALHNARIASHLRGADTRFISLLKI